MALPVPPSGFVLGAVAAASTSKGASPGFQAMRISFADLAVLEEVLKHGSDLKITFGKSMVRDSSRMNELVCSRVLFKGGGNNKRKKKKNGRKKYI